MNKRIISFDILRGLAAIAVMLYHYTCRYGEMEQLADAPTNFGFSVTWGFAAVSLFFILSGYFSGHHLTEYQPINWGGYMVGRVKRLYPAFFCSVIITFISTKLFLPELSCSYKDFVLNLSMIPGPLGAKPVDGAYWTLFVEWLFYLFVAALLIKPNNSIIRLSIISWMVISIGSYLIAGPSPSGVFKIVNYFLVTSYSSCFVAGIALYQLAMKKHNLYTYLYLGLASINVLLWQNTPSIVFYFITCILVYLFTHIDIEDKLANNPLAKICAWYGRVSYPFYLLHQVIGYVIIYNLSQRGYNQPWVLLVPFTTITVLSFVVNKYSTILIKQLSVKTSK